jgi:lactate racemase
MFSFKRLDFMNLKLVQIALVADETICTSQIQLKAKVLVKAGGLSEKQLRAAQFEPIEDVGAAVGEALKAAGPKATLCVLPQGPQTVPYLR